MDQPVRQGWLILILILLVLWHKPILKVYFILDYQEKIIEYSKENQVNPALVSAMVLVESGYNSKAQSRKGALGLMQVMPLTGSWVAERLKIPNYSEPDLLVPEKNLQIGIWYFAYLRRYFKDNDYLALASYNAGHRYVLNWVEHGIWTGEQATIEQIPFPETKKYLIKVLVFKKVYGYLYPELNSNRHYQAWLPIQVQSLKFDV